MKSLALLVCFAIAGAVGQATTGAFPLCEGRPVAATIDMQRFEQLQRNYTFDITPYERTNWTNAMRCPPYSIHNGVWVALTNIPIGLEVVVDTCGRTSIDTIVGFYPFCESGAGQNCVDDTCGRQTTAFIRATASSMYAFIGSFNMYDSEIITFQVSLRQSLTTAVPSLTTNVQYAGPMCNGRPKLPVFNINNRPGNQTVTINFSQYPRTSAVSCGPHNIANGLWMELSNVPIGYTITVSTCDSSTPTPVDTVIGFYANCGDDSTQSPCAEDSCGLFSSVTVTAYQTTLYALVGTYSEWSSGVVEVKIISVYGPTPAPTTAVPPTQCNNRPIANRVDANNAMMNQQYSFKSNQYVSNWTIPCQNYVIRNGIWVQISNVPLGWQVNLSTCGISSIDTIVGFYPACDRAAGYACGEDNCGTQSHVEVIAQTHTLWAHIGTYAVNPAVQDINYRITVSDPFNFGVTSSTGVATTSSPSVPPAEGGSHTSVVIGIVAVIAILIAGGLGFYVYRLKKQREDNMYSSLGVEYN